MPVLQHKRKSKIRGFSLMLVPMYCLQGIQEILKALGKGQGRTWVLCERLCRDIEHKSFWISVSLISLFIEQLVLCSHWYFKTMPISTLSDWTELISACLCSKKHWVYRNKVYKLYFSPTVWTLVFYHLQQILLIFTLTFILLCTNE